MRLIGNRKLVLCRLSTHLARNIMANVCTRNNKRQPILLLLSLRPIPGLSMEFNWITCFCVCALPALLCRCQSGILAAVTIAYAGTEHKMGRTCDQICNKRSNVIDSPCFDWLPLRWTRKFSLWCYGKYKFFTLWVSRWPQKIVLLSLLAGKALAWINPFPIKLHVNGSSLRIIPYKYWIISPNRNWFSADHNLQGKALLFRRNELPAKFICIEDAFKLQAEKPPATRQFTIIRLWNASKGQ